MPFWFSRVAKRSRFLLLFGDFGAPGAHARTVLPLQRELDLARSGGVGERSFFQREISVAKKGL